MATILTGGTVVNADAAFSADVKAEGERIAAVGALRPEPGDTVADVSGMCLFPGLL